MTEPKKTNLGHLLWIYMYGVSVTALHCTCVYMAAVFKRGSRRYFDEQIDAWSRKLVEMINLRFTIVNEFDVKLSNGKPTILMCNHSSLYDIPLTFQAMPGSIRMLTKKELFRIPVFGIGMRAAEFISIDRQNREQALKDLNVAKERMQSGIALWVAPEGTRSKSGVLLPFKKGGFHLAIETGAQIIPIGIVGINKVLPKKSLRIMLNIPVFFKIGKPIDASEYALEDKDRLMQEVRDSMLNLLEQEEQFH